MKKIIGFILILTLPYLLFGGLYSVGMLNMDSFNYIHAIDIVLTIAFLFILITDYFFND